MLSPLPLLTPTMGRPADYNSDEHDISDQHAAGAAVQARAAHRRSVGKPWQQAKLARHQCEKPRPIAFHQFPGTHD